MAREARLSSAQAVILLLWTATIAPRLVQTLTAAKFKAAVGSEVVPYSRLAGLLDRGLGLAVLGVCAVLLLHRARTLPKDGLGRVGLLLAPWCYFLVRDLARGDHFTLSTFTFALVAVTLWAVGAQLRDLGMLGLLTIVLAVMSMLIAVALPDKGVYRGLGGQLVQVDKAILPWGVLIGPLSNGNNLGQVLVMGLPAVGLVRAPAVRRWGAAAVSLAVVWTASRSSIGALAAVAVVALLLRRADLGLRQLIGVVSMTATGVMVCALPFLVTRDGQFTNRGYIWRVSLQAWRGRPLTGQGSRYYSEVAQLANSIAGSAFHGHNEVVQMLVTGGLAAAVLFGLLYLALVVQATGWLTTRNSYPTLFVVGFAVSCVLEVSFGIVDRDLFYPVTLVPMAVLLASRPTRPAAQRTRQPTRAWAGAP